MNGSLYTLLFVINIVIVGVLFDGFVLFKFYCKNLKETIKISITD